jgi:hypothetical protein
MDAGTETGAGSCSAPEAAPRPRTASSASAQVILVNDEAYVVDVLGNGVARQLDLLQAFRWARDSATFF